jgi:alpha-amylase
MGVMLQAFYWDCTKADNREHEWWTFIKSKLPGIAEAGFTALWLPPANKAAGWKSMGYDPYDYHDLVNSIRKAACLRGSGPGLNCSTLFSPLMRSGYKCMPIWYSIITAAAMRRN